MKHLFVINPAAGQKDHTKEIISQIETLLAEKDYEIYVTKATFDGMNFVKKYCMEHSQEEEVRIYSCGGDGTLNEVVNGAYGFPNVSVACYPSGSGNDFIKIFGPSENFLKMSQLIKGRTMDIDLIRFGNRFSINILNMGFDADVVERMMKYKRRPLMTGKSAYILGVLVTFLNKMGHHFRVSVDDHLIYDGKGLLCAAANSICYGGGFYCAPLAKINDGIIDVCFVKKVSRFSFIRMIGTYKAGKHLETPWVAKKIVYAKGKKVTIEIDRSINFSIDGEMGKASSITLEIVPNALKFVVPQSVSVPE